MKNSNYKLLLFDADETLFDFHRSEAVALKKTLAEMSIAGDHERLLSDYREINLGLWQKFERKEIALAELKPLRFTLLFERHQISAAVEDASRLYLEYLPENVFLFDQTLEICRELSRNFEMGIVTNGIDQHQRRRFALSGLSDFFSFLLSSEQAGCAKPDRRIFDHALSLSKFEAGETLMIGDRLEADILGAHNAGLDSCWYNPKRQKQTPVAQPTFEISELRELLDLRGHEL